MRIRHVNNLLLVILWQEIALSLDITCLKHDMGYGRTTIAFTINNLSRIQFKNWSTQRCELAIYQRFPRYAKTYCGLCTKNTVYISIGARIAIVCLGSFLAYTQLIAAPSTGLSQRVQVSLYCLLVDHLAKHAGWSVSTCVHCYTYTTVLVRNTGYYQWLHRIHNYAFRVLSSMSSHCLLFSNNINVAGMDADTSSKRATGIRSAPWTTYSVCCPLVPDSMPYLAGTHHFIITKVFHRNFNDLLGYP